MATTRARRTTAAAAPAATEPAEAVAPPAPPEEEAAAAPRARRGRRAAEVAAEAAAEIEAAATEPTSARVAEVPAEMAGKTFVLVLNAAQASWIVDLLHTASDGASGLIETTSGGGFHEGDRAQALAFLAATARSVTLQVQRQARE